MAIKERRLPSPNLNFKTQREQQFANEFEVGSDRALLRPFGVANWRLILPLLVFTSGAIIFFNKNSVGQPLIDLGKTDVNQNIVLNINLLLAIVLVIAALATVIPKAISNRQFWRNQNLLTSAILLIVLAVYFLQTGIPFSWMVVGLTLFTAIPLVPKALHNWRDLFNSFGSVLGIVFRLAIVVLFGFGIIGTGPFDSPNLGTLDYKIDRLETNALIGLLFIAAIIALTFFGSRLSIGVLVVFFLWWAFSIKGFGFSSLHDMLFDSPNGGRLLRSLFPPQWGILNTVINPMFLTIQTAVASTIIGIVVSLPLSILAARNTTPHPVVYNLVRFAINTIRAIPALVMALLFIPFVGLGPAAGIFGLAVHSVSVLTKLYAESFESVKPQPLEAMNAVGASGLKTFRWGVFPQAFPLVASYSIFNWESNGRDSTVVAFVGGGGIGLILQQNLSLFNYAEAAVALVVIILTVAVLDRFSDFVRSKII